jgi:hypothetical protein
MKSLTIPRTAFFVLLVATVAVGVDKTPRAYQKGTITGYETRLDTWNMNANSNKRRAKVYELKGADLILPD